MAKKDDIDISSSYDDFGEFDFNIDESGTKRDAVAQPSKIRTDYLPSVKSGFLEGLKRELSSKMPYTAAAVDQVSSIYNEAKQMTQSFASEATPLVRSIGRSTNRLMPLVRPFMPKGIYDKITGKLSQIPDEQGELSEEEKQSQQISADINAAFQGSDAQAQIRSNMENVIGNMRHKATMGALGGLLNQMQITNKFLTSSLMAYMKKDLELQYRQLYTQRDIASTLRGTAKVLEAELKNITHNSGLPDMIKAKDFQRRTTKMETVRDYTANFWKNLMGNFKNNVIEQLKSALEGVESVASGAADMAEMQAEMEGRPLNLRDLALKGMFKLGGNFVGSKLTGKLAKFGEVALGGFDSIFKNFNNNLIRGIEDYSNKDNLLGSLLSMFTPSRPQNDTKLQNVLAKNPTQPVQFDISTREAIVTIIPGYLAKLNKLVEDIKDPNTSHEELVYSTDERRFMGKSELNESAEKIIKSIVTPNAYDASTHLAITATGHAIRGAKADDIKKWFKEKDDKGRTNQQLVELFFQNLVRSERHVLDVEALDAYVHDTDINRSMTSYVNTAIEGLGDKARRIVRFVLSSLKKSNGDWNQEAIREYQAALDKCAAYYDVNAVNNNFSTVMNDMSEEKRESVFRMLENLNLYNRKTGELNLQGLKEYTAAQRADIDLDESINSWSSESAKEAMLRGEKFSFKRLLEASFDSVNGFMSGVAQDIKEGKDKVTKQLSGLADKGMVRIAGFGKSIVRDTFGDDALKAFELASGALLDRYKRANGAATLALDIALVSGDFSEHDLQLIKDYAEQSQEEDDSEKLSKMRLGVIGSLENEDLANIFAEATNGIVSKKDAINHFGDMKKRIALLREEEVFKNASSLLKSKYTAAKDKVTGTYSKVKSWLGLSSENVSSDATPESADKETGESKSPVPTQSQEDKQQPKSSIIDKAASAADTLREKSKSAGAFITETVDKLSNIHSGVNEVLVKGIDDCVSHVSMLDENVARIYTLLEKKIGNLTESELNELHDKAQKLKDELAAKREEQKPKQQGGFGKKLWGFTKGVVGALNPFKSLNAAKIAAKYQLGSTPESAFHADFQTYFAYRKEMDVCLASIMSHRNIITNTIHGMLTGTGKVIGGVARGFGAVGRGMVTAGGKILGGTLPALGYLGGGLIHGGAIALNGMKDIAFATGRRTWDFAKEGLRSAKNFIFGAGRQSFRKKEQWYDLYRKDEVGEKGWMTRPILSARTQKKGIFHIGPDGKATGKILATDDIAGPVMDKNGNQLINEEDWKIGLVNIEGKSIAQKAKEHNGGALIQLGGGSLLGGLASGLGSLLGGGLKGAGSVVAKLIGVNWDITKLLGSGIQKGFGFLKGLGSNIAASLGIGTSEKAQRKKYSVIIGELEKVNKTLEFIQLNGAGSKSVTVGGDADGDGDRDGSYKDQQQEKEKKEEREEKRSFKQILLGLAGREEKDGKIVKKKFADTWFGKAFNWVKDPSNWMNAAILGGTAFIIHHFVKKYGAKTVIEKVTDAIIKTSEVVVGIAEGVGWVADKSVDIWKWLKKKIGWGNDKPTPEQLGARRNVMQAQNAAHALRRGGGIIKGAKDVPGSISRPPVAKPNVPEVPATPSNTTTPSSTNVSQETPKPKSSNRGSRRNSRRARGKHARNSRPRANAPAPTKAPALAPGTPGVAGVSAPKPTVPKGKLPVSGVPKASATTDLADAVHVLDKVDDAGDAAKTGRPFLQFLEKIWDRVKTWCSGSFKMTGKGSSAIKNTSVGKYFDRVMKTLKVIQAKTPIGWLFGCIATFVCTDPRPAIQAGDRLMAKFSHGAAKAGEIMSEVGSILMFLAKRVPIIGRFVRILAFFSKCILWLIKIIAKFYAWIMDKVPELMGALTIVLIEWTDNIAINMSYELEDPNYMDEYWQAEHELFGSSSLGWGMAALEMIDMVNSFTARFKGPAKAKAIVVVSLLWLAYQGGRGARGKVTKAGVITVNSIKTQNRAMETGDYLREKNEAAIMSSPEGKKQTERFRKITKDKIWSKKAEDIEGLDDADFMDKLFGNDRVRLNQAGARKAEVANKVSMALRMIMTSKNLSKAFRDELLNQLELTLSAGLLDNRPVAVELYWAICYFADPTLKPDVFKKRVNLAETYKKYTEDKTKVQVLNGYTTTGTIGWIWERIPENLETVIAFADKLIANEKQASDATAIVREHELQEQRKRNTAKVELSARSKQNAGFAIIDSIFNSTKSLGITVNNAFENANVIFNEYLRNHDNIWPPEGIYEYGNAVFCIIISNVKDYDTRVSFLDKYPALDSVEGFLKDKYKAKIHHSVHDGGMECSWSCTNKNIQAPVAFKELFGDGIRKNKVYRYVIVFKKTDIVPAPVVTKVDTATVKATPPQGVVKKPEVQKRSGEKKPALVQPKPLPNSLKPKSEQYVPSNKYQKVVVDSILLPGDGESREEYEKRFAYECAAWKASTGDPLFNYFEGKNKLEAKRWRDNQIRNGQEPDGIEVNGEIRAPKIASQPSQVKGERSVSPVSTTPSSSLDPRKTQQMTEAELRSQGYRAVSELSPEERSEYETSNLKYKLAKLKKYKNMPWNREKERGLRGLGIPLSERGIDDAIREIEEKLKGTGSTPANVSSVPTPVSVARTPEPVKPSSMQKQPEQQPKVAAKTEDRTKSLEEQLAKQQAEIEALKLYASSNSVGEYLRKLCELQKAGNDIAKTNGDIQQKQNTVIAEELVAQGKNQKPVIVLPGNTQQIQTPPTNEGSKQPLLGLNQGLKQPAYTG